MKDLMFKRTTTTYDGDETNMPVTVMILSAVGDPDDDRYRIRLPESCKAVIVDGCDLNPHPDSPLTNVEFLTLIMERSKTAMIQPFVLQALEEFAKRVAAEDPEKLGSGFVSGELWRDTALETLGWFAARDADEQARRERVPA